MSLYPCCEGIFLLHIISKAVKCHCIHAVRVSSFSTSFPSSQMSLYPCCEGIFLLNIISKAVKCHCIHAVRVSSFSTSFPTLLDVTISMLWGYRPSLQHVSSVTASSLPSLFCTCSVLHSLLMCLACCMTGLWSWSNPEWANANIASASADTG